MKGINKILINKLIDKQERIKHAFTRLASSGGNFEPVHGKLKGLYSLRAGIEERIILCRRQYKGESVYTVLMFLENHKYPSLKAKVSNWLQIGENELENNFNEYMLQDDMEIIAYSDQEGGENERNEKSIKLKVLSNDQVKVLRNSYMARIIQGPPGAGKSTLANILLSMGDIERGLFLVPNAKLLDQQRRHFKVLLDNKYPKTVVDGFMSRVEFITIDDFMNRSRPEPYAEWLSYNQEHTNLLKEFREEIESSELKSILVDKKKPILNKLQNSKIDEIQSNYNYYLDNRGWVKDSNFNTWFDKLRDCPERYRGVVGKYNLQAVFTRIDMVGHGDKNMCKLFGVEKLNQDQDEVMQLHEKYYSYLRSRGIINYANANEIDISNYNCIVVDEWTHNPVFCSVLAGLCAKNAEESTAIDKRIYFVGDVHQSKVALTLDEMRNFIDSALKTQDSLGIDKLTYGFRTPVVVTNFCNRVMQELHRTVGVGNKDRVSMEIVQNNKNTGKVQLFTVEQELRSSVLGNGSLADYCVFVNTQAEKDYIDGVFGSDEKITTIVAENIMDASGIEFAHVILVNPFDDLLLPEQGQASGPTTSKAKNKSLVAEHSLYTAAYKKLFVLASRALESVIVFNYGNKSEARVVKEWSSVFRKEECLGSSSKDEGEAYVDRYSRLRVMLRAGREYIHTVNSLIRELRAEFNPKESEDTQRVLDILQADLNLSLDDITLGSIFQAKGDDISKYAEIIPRLAEGSVDFSQIPFTCDPILQQGEHNLLSIALKDANEQNVAAIKYLLEIDVEILPEASREDVLHFRSIHVLKNCLESKPSAQALKTINDTVNKLNDHVFTGDIWNIDKINPAWLGFHHGVKRNSYNLFSIIMKYAKGREVIKSLILSKPEKIDLDVLFKPNDNLIKYISDNHADELSAFWPQTNSALMFCDMYLINDDLAPILYALSSSEYGIDIIHEISSLFTSKKRMLELMNVVQFHDDPLKRSTTMQCIHSKKGRKFIKELMSDTGYINDQEKKFLLIPKGGKKKSSLWISFADQIENGLCLDYAFLQASENNYLDLLTLCIKVGIDVNTPNKFGCTALMAASKKGRVEVVADLLRVDNISINQSDNQGGTALMSASSANVVSMLLNEGDIDVNIGDAKGMTALMLAVEECKLDILPTLLADKNVDLNITNNDGFTALSLSVKTNKFAIAKCFLDHMFKGFDIDKISQEEINIIDEQSVFKNISPLFYICKIKDINACNDGISQLIEKRPSLLRDISADDLNRVIQDGEDKDKSILYLLSDTTRGRTFILENIKIFEKKISANALNHIIQQGESKGSSPLIGLCTVLSFPEKKPGENLINIIPRLILTDSEILMEKVSADAFNSKKISNGISPVLLLARLNIPGLNIPGCFFKTPELYKKISIESMYDTLDLHVEVGQEDECVINIFFEKREYLKVLANTPELVCLENLRSKDTLDQSISSCTLYDDINFENKSAAIYLQYLMCTKLKDVSLIQKDSLDIALQMYNIELSYWLIKFVERTSKMKLNDKTLLLAAKHGNINIVKWLCNFKDLKPSPLILYFAAKLDDNELFHWLSSTYHMQVDATIIRMAENSKDQLLLDKLQTYKTYTDFFEASTSGDLLTLTKLVAEGVDVNVINRVGGTALMIAAKKGHIEMIDYLLKAKDIAVNQSNQSGDTALMIAAKKGHVEIVHRLLKVEGIQINQVNKLGCTALKLAEKSKNNVVVALLSKAETFGTSLDGLNKAISLDANNVFALLRRGEIYGNQKKYDEALADLNKAISLDANNVLALAVRGDVYGKQKKYDEALVDLNKAIRLDANNVFALAVRGDVYGKQKKYDEALVDLNKAIRLDANNVIALAMRGDVYRLQGKYMEALDDKVIEPNEEDRSSENSLGSSSSSGGAGMFAPPHANIGNAAHSEGFDFLAAIMDPDSENVRLLPLNAAASKGNLEMVQWLMEESNLTPNTKTLNSAAQSGNLELVQWFTDADRGSDRVMPNQETLNSAARSGNLELVQWLMDADRGSDRVMPNQETLNSAARSGNLELVQWLMDADIGLELKQETPREP